ncbi:MAG TPA: polysaccharide biosynthesis/export family protein [Pyrinomonadaceae bacterium]|jgi:polysaccharide export outer membrane protein
MNRYRWRNLVLGPGALTFLFLGPIFLATTGFPKNAFAQSERPLVTSSASSTSDNRYRIGPGDVLDVRVFNRPNISRDAVRVEGSGMIRMPLIESEIQAACKTEGELAKDIAELYKKFYRNPQVDVFVKEYHSKQVAVIGAVNDQARFQLQRRVRLLELLTYAKGPSAKAGQTINIVRAEPTLPCEKANAVNDDLTAFSSFRLADTLIGKPEANPYLAPGDIVTIPEAEQVYVVGNVFTPLTIPLKEPVTLSRAIAMAGGLRQDSKKDKVRIVRQETGSAVRKEMIVDLSAIEKKSAEDVALMPNDIVDVPTSAGKSFLRSLVGGVVPSVTQLPVRIVP